MAWRGSGGSGGGRRGFWPGAVLAVALTLPAQADTLDDALVRAYRSNPQINASRAQQRATDENVPQALSGYRP